MGLWLAASDVFVLNTKYEGFSHVILEAFASGIPVVTTPVGGNSELVVNEITGLLVSPDSVPQLSSAIIKVVTDSVFANTLAQSARASLVRFNSAHSLQQLRSLFQTL
jgi:glycosyltransferase involved in cell wall biosynthesis